MQSAGNNLKLVELKNKFVKKLQEYNNLSKKSKASNNSW